jgi:hypothetical protein
VAVLFIASTGNAQNRKILNLPNYDRQTIHFGFLLGINTLDFVTTPIKDIRLLDSLNIIQNEKGAGFSLGIISNLHLGDNFDLRFMPTLSFGERKITYTINFKTFDSLVTRFKPVESTLLEFPLLLKFKSARHNNFRTYVIGGVKPLLDLASQNKVDDKGEKILKLKRNDLNLEIGVGFDFYSQYFKFSPELKMSYGLSNLLVQENNIYTGGLSALRSKAFYFSITFE